MGKSARLGATDRSRRRHQAGAKGRVRHRRSRILRFLKKHAVEIVLALVCTFLAWAADMIIDLRRELDVVQSRIDYIEKHIDASDSSEEFFSFAQELYSIKIELALLEQQLSSID